MDELYSTIHSLTSSSHQSTWMNSSLLFILTSSSLSSHGRALLYYSFIDELFPSVNMDELHFTFYYDELFPSVNMDELYSTIYIDELFPSVNMNELYSTIHFDELFPSVNMDELYSTIHSLTSSSHQSTWTSSTQLFILTSSSLSSHGRALL